MSEDSFFTKNNIFFSKVEPRFNSFKTKIMKFSKLNKISFDEDVFMDTIIRCSETFKVENATNEDIDKYFWVAFKQNYYSKFKFNKFEQTVNLDDIDDDIIDEPYNSDIDEIIYLIKKEVYQEFGEKFYLAWIAHIEDGITYDELENKGYNKIELHNIIRQIKRHIKNQYVKNNKILKSLLFENGLI
jgi:hypothetical protein